ncbi:YfhH family protein [Sutcliffiella horikoshii]|uniref:YfhH family protein n=1 Tax=Sutcliffiella horikoshii TaxID=79883 RepID=UPI002F267B8D
MEQEKRYSQMTSYELHQEIATLKEKARKAEQLGIVNEFAVLERKITMAKAYMLNPDDYKPGAVYEIEGDPGVHFKITYMNGVFAWGHRVNGDMVNKEEEGLPISMLLKEESKEV